VILVRNEAARLALPDELRVGLVMTVFEAKGLEFDDVLLCVPFPSFYVLWLCL
jgi:hypothetical protein